MEPFLAELSARVAPSGVGSDVLVLASFLRGAWRRALRFSGSRSLLRTSKLITYVGA